MIMENPVDRKCELGLCSASRAVRSRSLLPTLLARNPDIAVALFPFKLYSRYRLALRKRTEDISMP